MADQTPQKPDLTTHPLVAKLKGDSDTPPSLVALTGYFGPSKKADSIRLYTSLNFQSYYEIPKAAIVATTAVDSKDDQSATIVHVKTGTPVDAIQTSTQPVESYLQGSIAALDLNPQPLPPGFLQPTPTAIPTHQIYCTHVACVHPTTTVLPTHPVFCTETCVPTHLLCNTAAACLTQNIVCNVSHVAICNTSPVICNRTIGDCATNLPRGKPC